MKTYKSERALVTQVNNLKEESNQQKEKLKRSGTLSFEDTTSINSLKKELVKIQEEVNSCNEREYNERLESQNLEAKKKELEDYLEGDRKRKIEELEPKIAHLKQVVNDMKVRFDWSDNYFSPEDQIE